MIETTAREIVEDFDADSALYLYDSEETIEEGQAERDAAETQNVALDILAMRWPEIDPDDEIEEDMIETVEEIVREAWHIVRSY